jgi:hypothetical protein
MDGNTNSFGIRGFLIDTPEFGALRARPTRAPIIAIVAASQNDLASLLPYPKKREALSELSTEDALALCIYRGGPHANLDTHVRDKCIYQAPALAQSS